MEVPYSCCVCLQSNASSWRLRTSPPQHNGATPGIGQPEFNEHLSAQTTARLCCLTAAAGVSFAHQNSDQLRPPLRSQSPQNVDSTGHQTQHPVQSTAPTSSDSDTNVFTTSDVFRSPLHPPTSSRRGQYRSLQGSPPPMLVSTNHIVDPYGQSPLI